MYHDEDNVPNSVRHHLLNSILSVVTHFRQSMYRTAPPPSPNTFHNVCYHPILYASPCYSSISDLSVAKSEGIEPKNKNQTGMPNLHCAATQQIVSRNIGIASNEWANKFEFYRKSRFQSKAIQPHWKSREGNVNLGIPIVIGTTALITPASVVAEMGFVLRMWISKALVWSDWPCYLQVRFICHALWEKPTEPNHETSDNMPR